MLLEAWGSQPECHRNSCCPCGTCSPVVVVGSRLTYRGRGAILSTRASGQQVAKPVSSDPEARGQVSTGAAKGQNWV